MSVKITPVFADGDKLDGLTFETREAAEKHISAFEERLDDVVEIAESFGLSRADVVPERYEWEEV